jgi:sugar lactone lactonase YvrE
MGIVRQLSTILTLCVASLSAQTPERVIALQGETHHVQGVALAAGRFLVTSVERQSSKGWLIEFDGDGNRLRETQIHDGAMFHPGGFDMDESSIWIPVAEYRAKSRSRIQRRSLETFELISSFDVPDHIGALALASDRMYLANWDARRIYEYSLDGKLIRVRDNPTSYRYQDLKSRYGTLVGSAPAAKGAAGGTVVWLDPETLLPTMEQTVGRTGRGVSLVQEGVDLRDGRIYLLPEDTPSRVFVFNVIQLTAAP